MTFKVKLHGMCKQNGGLNEMVDKRNVIFKHAHKPKFDFWELI